MDKILQSTSGKGGMEVTNDGATILRSLHIDNPAAKVLVNLAKVQDQEVGDGTTSVCVLASELLREAERLVDARIHPQTIISGFRGAAAIARRALEASAIDRSADKAAFEDDLLKIARTTLSSKILAQDKERFAKIAVDAVLRLNGSTDLERIAIVRRTGGKLEDSFLAEGLIFDKQIVGSIKKVTNAKILIANTAMDTDKVKIFGSKFKATGPEHMAQLEAAERDAMRTKVDRIKSHGVNVFVNRQLVYNWPMQLLNDAGILTIEHADFEGVERLALVTGGQIASTFEHPETAVLGVCDVVEEIVIGEDRLLRFGGTREGAACTVVLRGATEQILAEAERSLHDAFCVLSQTVREPRVVLGGGCSEMLMSNAIDAAALQSFSGKELLAAESFSRALRQLPTIIADNAGLDGSELVAHLRTMHAQGFKTAGIDVVKGQAGDVADLGIVEALKLKLCVLNAASEAAEMILRVDDIIKAAPRARQAH